MLWPLAKLQSRPKDGRLNKQKTRLTTQTRIWFMRLEIHASRFIITPKYETIQESSVLQESRLELWSWIQCFEHLSSTRGEGEGMLSTSLDALAIYEK